LYAGWTPERWETPVSDVPVLFLDSLVDDGDLHITVDDVRGRRRWRFTFSDAPAYLNILEEYRLELATVERHLRGLGRTVRVVGSPWLAYLYRSEALLTVHRPALQHFQVGTETAIVDVLAENAPGVVELPFPDADPGAAERAAG
jgi:hypothetical protein